MANGSSLFSVDSGKLAAIGFGFIGDLRACAGHKAKRNHRANTW
jgi:hypothetical protein